MSDEQIRTAVGKMAAPEADKAALIRRALAGKRAALFLVHAAPQAAGEGGPVITYKSAKEAWADMDRLNCGTVCAGRAGGRGDARRGRPRGSPRATARIWTSEHGWRDVFVADDGMGTRTVMEVTR